MYFCALSGYLFCFARGGLTCAAHPPPLRGGGHCCAVRGCLAFAAKLGSFPRALRSEGARKSSWAVFASSRAPARGAEAKLERRLQAAPHCGAMQLAAQRRGCAIPDKIPSQADKSSIQGNIQSPAANAALSGSLSGAEREHPRSFSLLQYHISFVLASLTATQDRPSPFPRDRAPRRRPPRRRAGRPGNTG